MKHDAIVPSTSVGIKEMSLDELSKKVSEWSNRIAKRAYDLFAASGFTNGHDLDDWFKAEQELLKPIHPHVKDWGDEFVVIAEVPGFDAKDLNIQVNGAHVVIQGRHELSEERKEKSGNVSERNVHEIYHAFELPAGVVAKGAQADLKNGGLGAEAAQSQQAEANQSNCCVMFPAASSLLPPSSHPSCPSWALGGFCPEHFISPYQPVN